MSNSVLEILIIFLLLVANGVFAMFGGRIWRGEPGSIPTVGQGFEWGKLRFEVVDMDGRRVDKVLVTPGRPEERRDA